MKLLTTVAMATLSSAILVTSAAAQSAAGSWNGKLNLQLPAAVQTQMKNNPQMAQMMSMYTKMTFSLRLNADKTYALKVNGLPTFGAKKAPDNTDTGTWSQKGDTITLASGKHKPTGTQPVPTLKIATGGKSMVMAIPTGPGGGSGKIVFSR